MLCLGIMTRSIAVTTSGAWTIDIGHGHAHQCVGNRSGRRGGSVVWTLRFADWSDECSVVLSPVGDIRIEYIWDPVDRGQSTYAAPLTELLDFYTHLHIYNNCATRSASIWTFCGTVWDNISSEELTRRCGDFSVCQTMNGAALVDDRSGVTFNAELCIPWDAPEAVVDIDSAELISLGSFPDKVGLFGR